MAKRNAKAKRLVDDPTVARSGGSAGPSVDAAGFPVYDPSANVIDLVTLNVKRMDDLRVQSETYHLREADLRERFRQREADLNEQHQKEQRQAEAARIDANRATDLAAVASAAQVSATSVTALAKSTTDIAEAARASVTQSATVVGDNLTRQIDPINRRLDEIQRVQTLQLGAQAGSQDTTADASALAAVLRPMVDEIKRLGQEQTEERVRRTTGVERTTERRLSTGLIVSILAGVAVYLSLLLVAVGLIIRG